MHARRFIVGTFLCSAVLHAQDQPDAIGNGMHPYPLWPSKPVAGWPGVAVDDKTTFEKLKGLGMGLATYGQPEFLAYPGAVHHVRHVYQRRITPYPLYNQHTLVKNFILHQMPAHAARCVDFAEPVYYTPNTAPRLRTSKNRPVVKALPWKTGATIRLDLGVLPRSVYTLRPIVAAPAATKTQPPTLVRFRLRVNDDPANKNVLREYTLHARVLDNFYAVQEFMFRSPGDGRRLTAELQCLDAGPGLLLHNIDLHDHLAQLPKRRLKTRTSFDGLLPADSKAREALWAKNRQANPEAWAALQKQTRTVAEQHTLDDAIWRQSMPPPNTHLVGNSYYLQRAKPLPMRFMHVGAGQPGPLYVHAPKGELFVEAGKPFGRVFTEKPKDLAVQSVKVEPGWQLDAAAVADLFASGIATTSNAGLNPRAKPVLEPWVKFGHRPAAREAALRLIRFAWHAPLMNPKHALAYVAGFEGLERGLIFHRGLQPTLESLRYYDLLYEFIATDAELARAVGRHLPWVKTPADVVTLIDTHLVQDFANRLLHYRQYSDAQVDDVLFLVRLANHHPDTRPWMEFIFTNSRQFPLAQGGLTDPFVTDSTRDGAADRGSFAMGLALPAGFKPTLGNRPSLASSFEAYLKSGGDAAFDINSRTRHPVRWQLPYFLLEGSIAGRINPGIGADGGPAEPYGRFTDTPEARQLIALGWQLHRDPRFAHELVHQFGHGKETDADWRAITQAAARQPRDAYLANRSRVLSQWSGILEDGPVHDDFRFRRAAAVRVGAAYGYFAHRDTLDLRLFAFGLTMSGDFNQQQGYGWPPQRTTRLHNVVEVDGQNWRGHAWVRGLLDAPGSQYLSAEAPAPHDLPQVKFFRRQVAMIETHPGKPSAKTEPRTDAGIALPGGYVVDVFRVSGGKQHVYNFHGCVDDQFTVNAANRQLPNVPAEVDYLAPYRPAVIPKDLKLAPPGGFPLNTPPDYWAGTVTGEHLTATWRLRREAEQRMLGNHAALTAPRKFIRLQLLGQKGNRVLHGIARGKDGNGFYGRCLHTVREANESVFTAVIETFAGEPSITAIRLLAIANNEADARRATAIEVQTRRGRRDVVFADGRSERVRQLPKMKIAAEYALVSRDAKGLQHAVLHAGTLLDCGELKIEPERAAYTAVIESADYDKRTFVVTGQLPAYLAGQFFEAGNNDHRTSVEIAKLAPAGGKTVVTTRKSLELMRAHSSELNGAAGTMRGNIAKLRLRGRDAGLTATNAEGSKSWRARYDDTKGIQFTLSPIEKTDGPVFRNADFPGGYLRLWDTGPGDELTLRTSVALRRVEGADTTYRVTATCSFKLTAAGKAIFVSADGKRWTPHPARTVGGKLETSITPTHKFVRIQ